MREIGVKWGEMAEPESPYIHYSQLFFPKPPTTFLTCFCRGGRRKYAGNKVRLNRGSNSQSPGHESDMLTTEPPGGWGSLKYGIGSRGLIGDSIF